MVAKCSGKYIFERSQTSDSRLMNRLSKKYECTKEHRNEGKVVAIEFKVPESYITFRSPRPIKKEADA